MITKQRVKFHANWPRYELNIGCGDKLGFAQIGIDIQDFGQHILWDIRKGLPIPDDTFYSVYSSHCLEHFTMPEIEQILYEILRVCVNGATVQIIVPNGDTIQGHFPCHYTYWGTVLAKGIDTWLDANEPMRFSLVSCGAINDVEFEAKFIVVKK